MSTGPSGPNKAALKSPTKGILLPSFFPLLFAYMSESSAVWAYGFAAFQTCKFIAFKFLLLHDIQLWFACCPPPWRKKLLLKPWAPMSFKMWHGFISLQESAGAFSFSSLFFFHESHIFPSRPSFKTGKCLVGALVRMQERIWTSLLPSLQNHSASRSM